VKNRLARFRAGLYVAVSGAAIGWLAGLSVSPVIQVTITSLLTILVSLTSALASLESSGTAASSDSNRSKWKALSYLSPAPVALLVLSLACGASLGAYARSNDWLGANARRIAEQWQETGLPRAEILLRVFNQRFPPLPAENGAVTTQAASSRQGVLFSVPMQECARFRAADGEDLRREMLSSTNDRVARFAKQCKTPDCLRAAVEELLCPGSE
jgi:hypothetical protein